MAEAAADVGATSLGLLQSSGASANANTRAAPSENPARPAQNTVQPLAEVIIPTTQLEDSTPNNKYGHRLPCNLSAVSSRRKEAGTCPALRAVRAALMSSWRPFPFKHAGKNPLRQK